MICFIIFASLPVELADAALPLLLDVDDAALLVLLDVEDA